MFRYTTMKITVLTAVLLLAVSCAPQQKIVSRPEAPAPPVKTPQPTVTAPVMKYRSVLQCDEKTEGSFNTSGLEILPFVRVAFYDIDGDGAIEMIAGSKDGSLRLYRNSGTRTAPHWRPEPDYFAGIRVGAFSAPAVGDIDGDGRPEIVVGTGGFSKDSGRVICYRNLGTPLRPVWQRMDMPEIAVGNDATPALIDVDHDGRLDLVVGNSTGQLFLFRNIRRGKDIVYVKDAAYFKGINLGMYVVPAVTANKNKLLLIAGNSMGKLYLLERSEGAGWLKSALHLSVVSFAAPAFIAGDRPGATDLVISDGDGQLSYYRNRKGDFRDWDKTDDFFSGRTLTGAASAPVISKLSGRSVMVVGNINGEIRLFEKTESVSEVSWKEKPGFFRGIKLSSFSRGILTDWEGRLLLITGQQDGVLRAFLNSGSHDKPSWSEKKDFFRGIPKIRHAAPSVFDIYGDGNWNLIVGGADGYVKGFRYAVGQDGAPLWKRIDRLFDYAKVDGYASPSLARDEGKTYLFVGQQDGKIRVFTSDPGYWGNPVFYPDDYLDGIQVCNHSCPAAVEKMGTIELAVGDYNGNLKYFACHSEKKAIKN